MVSSPARFAASQSHVESPTMTPSLPPALASAAWIRSGSGFVCLHVGGGRPGVGELARVEQLEVVVDLLLLGRAREHDRVAEGLEVLDQAPRSLELLDLVDQLAL